MAPPVKPMLSGLSLWVWQYGVAVALLVCLLPVAGCHKGSELQDGGLTADKDFYTKHPGVPYRPDELARLRLLVQDILPLLGTKQYSELVENYGSQYMAKPVVSRHVYKAFQCADSQLGDVIQYLDPPFRPTQPLFTRMEVKDFGPVDVLEVKVIRGSGKRTETLRFIEEGNTYKLTGIEWDAKKTAFRNCVTRVIQGLEKGYQAQSPQKSSKKPPAENLIPASETWKNPPVPVVALTSLAESKPASKVSPKQSSKKSKDAQASKDAKESKPKATKPKPAEPKKKEG